MRFPTLALLLLSAASAAELNLAVPPSLRPQGIPEIPASLMEDLAAYTEFRTASLAAWHPQRREILIGTRFGDVPQIHRVTMPGGARTQLTFYPDRVAGGRYRPRTGDVFLFSKDVGGGEWYQTFAYDTRTGRARMITDGKSRNSLGLWSRDGKLVAYSSTRRNGKDNDIYVANPDDPQSTRLVAQVESGGWFPAAWMPDGKSFIAGHFKSAYEMTLYAVDLATGVMRAVTPSRPGVLFGDPEVTPDGKGMYVITNQDSDFQRLAYLDLSSGQVRFLRPDLKWDVTSIALAEDGRYLSYVVNEAGAGVLHVLETATGKEAPLPRLPYGSIAGVRWRPNAPELGFTLSSARSPSDVYSIDISSGKLERWTYSETGGLDSSQFVEPELIQWKTFDGLNISGFYYKPPSKFTGPRPVIVNIHGGPEGQYQPGYLGSNNYLLNELGVAIIFPNVRGSEGYGKTFLNLDNGFRREDSVKDIGALLDWIATRPDLDARRVMVTGGSYGGYMTLAVMTHYNDRLRCAVDVVGISNWITFLERTEAYRRDLRRVEYGDERDPKMRAFLESISPVRHVNRITRPMFIVQGRNDPRVPYTESEQMVEAIRKNGGPVWYLLGMDEGHGFSKKRNRDFQLAATVMFIRQYLLN